MMVKNRFLRGDRGRRPTAHPVAYVQRVDGSGRFKEAGRKPVVTVVKHRVVA